MKQFNKLWAVLMVLCALLVASLSARADALGYDYFAVPRTVVPSGLPRILDVTAATFTNGPVDIGNYIGNVAIDVTSVTNAGGALTLTIYQSNDQTNWNSISNFALIKTPTSYSYTNRIYGGTNVYATNPYLLPGTVTTYTGGTSGFVGTKMDFTTVPYTNSGAVTITSKGQYKIGLPVGGAQRYLNFVWTPTGTSSNDIVNLSVTGVMNREVEPGQ